MSVSLGRVCMSVNMWQNTDNEEKTGNKDNVQNRIVPWADMKKGGSRTVSVCWEGFVRVNVWQDTGKKEKVRNKDNVYMWSSMNISLHREEEIFGAEPV